MKRRSKLRICKRKDETEAIMANFAKYVWLDDGLKDAAQSGVPIVNAGLHYEFQRIRGPSAAIPPGSGPAIFPDGRTH